MCDNCGKLEDLTRWNVDNLPLSSPFHPPYIDPLYAPYYKPCDKCPPTSPYKRNPPYPLVDPARTRLGWGVRYRSQADGIAMPDYVMGPNQMAYPKPPETYGPFYTDDIYKTYDGAASIYKGSMKECESSQCRDPRVW